DAVSIGGYPSLELGRHRDGREAREREAQLKIAGEPCGRVVVRAGGERPGDEEAAAVGVAKRRRDGTVGSAEGHGALHPRTGLALALEEDLDVAPPRPGQVHD